MSNRYANALRTTVFFLSLFLYAQLSAQTYNMSTTPVTTCSGTWYDGGGSASNYGNSQNVTQTFTSANGNRLSFQFNSFSIETCCDRLYIYDGPSNAYPLIGTYTSNPGTIVSSGTTLTFVFTSDVSGTGSGWDATISCTTAPLTNYNLTSGTTTACSGNIFDSGGPSAGYSNNENITHTFCSGTSDFLQFSFLTNATNLASGDTLFIYDGASTSSPLIGAYVTASRIETFTSSGTCVTISFKSNASGTASGWAGSFTCTSVPGSPLSYSMTSGIRGTCGGTFYDSGGSGNNYGNSEGRTQTFISTNGNRLEAVFSSFSVETCCDRLYIYDGPGTSYPLIGVYTSNPGTVQATGTALTFYFTSDGTNTGSGWAAALSCTTAPLTVYPAASGTVTACSGVVCDNGGMNNNYTDNQNITQTFTSANGNYLQFQFWTNATGFSAGDSLFVYDGPTTSSPVIGVYVTGSTIETFTSSGTSVTFRLKTNASGNSSGYAGWFTCTTTPPSVMSYAMSTGIRGTCGGNFYDAGGSGNNYPNNENRTQTFVSTNGNRLEVTFTSFSVETCCDRIYIYDGPSTAYPLIGMYTSNPGTILATGTSLTFGFYSDGSNTGSGWAATFSCTTPPLTQYPIASGTIVACSGFVCDNGGPSGNYTNSANITQTFTSGSSDFLQFTFWTAATSLMTGDTLWVYNGANTSAPLIGAYTGGSTLESFTSSGNAVTFQFKSNATSVGAGWAGWFNCTTTPATPPVFNMSTGIRGVCSGTFYDSGGSGNNYANSENRTQTFVSTNGERLQLTFTSFSLETCCDRMYIYDGPNSSYPLLGAYATSPGTITSSGTSITIGFYSDGSNTGSGWSANIACAGPVLPVYTMSSGTIVTCGGVFYDAGGPNANYPNNENRVMTFTSASGQYLQFAFNGSAFGIEWGDSLFIYDGPSISSPPLAILTAYTGPGTITSNTPSLTFRFKSNGTTVAQGWQAWITCVNAPNNNPQINMSAGVYYTCGGNFFDSGGPAGWYPDNEYKVMTFYSNSGCGIRFTFTQFNTESCCDRLYVYDGPSTSSPLIGQYSGSGLPPVLQSSGNCLTFAFSSDGSQTGSGWAATISCPTQPLATITSSGPTNICAGDSVVLTAANNASYLWNTGATTQSITVTTNGSYWCTVTNASGCVATSTITSVSVNPAPVPVITASGPTTFCQGDTVTLTASGGGTYLWSTGSTQSAINVTGSGSYSVTATDPNGCSASSAVMNVTVNPSPTPLITASGSLNLCAGDSVTLTANGGNSYVWSTGAVTSSITVNQPGTYNVYATNASGCSDSANAVAVNVYAYPVAGISASGSTTFCQGGSVTLNASGGSSYVWSNSASGSSIIVGNSGTYSVIAYNAAGCADTSSAIAVTVHTLPAVALSLPQDTFCLLDPVFLLTGASPAGGTWNGPGVSGNTFDPQSAGVGIHTIAYTVSDSNSCQNTATQTVYVDICTGIPVTDSNNKFFAYPNPATQVVSIVWQDEAELLNIRDVTGRIVYSVIVSGVQQLQVDVQELAAGVYTVELNGVSPKAIPLIINH